MTNSETVFLVLIILGTLVLPFLWMAWQGAKSNTENYIYQ